MKLIVGLGNPGKAYIDTRHNIGFSLVKYLAKLYRVTLKNDRAGFSLSARCRIENQPVLLALPLTFMNLSGLALKALLKKYKIGLDDLLVVSDDFNLELGRLKIRSAGSSGGHRGLQSIIECLKSDRFCRLRIGTGKPHQHKEISNYVLEPFSRKEKEVIKSSIKHAGECCRTWVEDGITQTMNIFNKRSVNE